MYQNENLSVRVSDEFMKGRHGGQGVVDPHRHQWKNRFKRGCQHAPEQDSRKGTWDLRRPRPAIRRCHSEMAHLQGHGNRFHSTNPASEYVFPEQHCLQLGLTELDEV